MLGKKVITGPGSLLAYPAPGDGHLLVHLLVLAAGVVRLLLLEPLMLLFE